VWAPPGSRTNLAIIGEVAVWRAANGIHPNDPPPTGPAQLQIASALRQHHSTEVSPATTSAGIKSERTTVLDPREIAGQKIDSACPN
jgi:hypothetical protein